jgi:hypothetical protein
VAAVTKLEGADLDRSPRKRMLVWVSSSNHSEREKAAIVLWFDEAAVFMRGLDEAGLHAPLWKEAKAVFGGIYRLEAVFVPAALPELEGLLAVSAGFFRCEEDEWMVLFRLRVDTHQGEDLKVR